MYLQISWIFRIYCPMLVWLIEIFFSYAPQDSVPAFVQRTDPEIMFHMADLAEGNTYQWFRNGTAFLEEDSPTIRVGTSGPVAEYHCVIENDSLPDLTLTGVVSHQKKQETVATGQNFSNPAKTWTVIPSSMIEPGPIRITVYDVLGRKALRLTEKVLATGEQVVWMNTGSLSAGRYNYMVHTGGEQITRTMVVIR